MCKKLNFYLYKNMEKLPTSKSKLVSSFCVFQFSSNKFRILKSVVSLLDYSETMGKIFWVLMDGWVWICSSYDVTCKLWVNEFRSTKCLLNEWRESLYYITNTANLILRFSSAKICKEILKQKLCQLFYEWSTKHFIWLN